MKKSFKVLCLMLIVFMMSGCVKLNVDMSIHKDKSMDLTIIEAVSNVITQNSDEEMFSESDLAEVKNNGFTIEEYSDDSMTGYKFTKKISNIDDISDNKSFVASMDSISGNDSSNLFYVKKGLFKNTYSLKMKEELKDSFNSGFEEGLNSDDTGYSNTDYYDYNSTEDYSENTPDYTSLMNNMDMKFTINLPYKAISSNATTVNNNGKQLTWDLTKFSEDNIEFSFDLYNMTNIYIAVGLAIILIIVIIIIIIKKRKPKAPIATPIPVNDQPIVNTESVPATPIVNNSPAQTQMNTDISVQPSVEQPQDNSDLQEPMPSETQNVTEPTTLAEKPQTQVQDAPSNVQNMTNDNLTNTKPI